MCETPAFGFPLPTSQPHPKNDERGTHTSESTASRAIGDDVSERQLASARGCALSYPSRIRPLVKWVYTCVELSD